MTTNVLVVTAEAVKTALEGLTLSQRFTVQRNYGDWEDLLSDQDTDLRIDVIPQNTESVIFNRAKHENRLRISIYLRKKLTEGDYRDGRVILSVIDQLINDLQTVHEYFVPSQPNQNGLRLSSVQQARWLEGSIKAAYSRKMLKAGQYSGWAEVIFGYAKEAGA